MTSNTWNTETERQVFSGMLAVIETLLEDTNAASDESTVDTRGELSVSSSSIEDMTLQLNVDSSSSDDLASLNDIFASDDDSGSEESFIDHAIDHVFAFGETIFGTWSEKRRVTYRENDMTIKELPDNEYTVLEFRFRKNDLQFLSELLWPRIQPYLSGEYSRIILPNRNYINFETGLLMLLYRLIHPKRIRPEMESRFECSPTRISIAIKEFAMAFHNLSLKYLGNIRIWKDKIPYYAELIRDKTEGISRNVWSFIDGTLRRSCRPGRHQKIAYSGHKRHHGLKYQSVYLPDGIMGNLYGPIPGSRHDSFMLSESGIFDDLQIILPDRDYSIYGDPAYPQSAWIHGGYRNPAGGSEQAEYNTIMSKVRETVEWGFKDIIQQFSYLDFKKEMMIFRSPIASYYFVACFFQNLRVCLYGNETSLYFGSLPMSIEEYLALIDISEDDSIE